VVDLCGLGDALLEATFVARDNRFRVTVELNGEYVWTHLGNSGRLTELLTPGRRLFLRPVTTQGRKTAYDLLLVDLDGVLVSVDARLPNALIGEALREGNLAPFDGYETIRREVRWGGSRLDFVLEDQSRRCLIEAKSVTLVKRGVALFPDAPTVRGRRHVEELRRAAAQGERAAIVFVVQRGDASAFASNDEADPTFGVALRAAVKGGVEVYAYACRVSQNQVRLGRDLKEGWTAIDRRVLVLAAAAAVAVARENDTEQGRGFVRIHADLTIPGEKGRMQRCAL